MIEINGLARQWGDFSLRSISLRVESGEYFVVLGPCGCGKTLLLETIAGLHQPYSGNILLDGEKVDGLPPEMRNVGLLYQQLCLFPHLSVRDNIAYGLNYAKMSRTERKERVEEMIDLLEIENLADRKSPVGLSGGESQKVALARAIAVQPEVILLDEPLASLDYVARRRISEILRDINQNLDVTMVHVTHDYTEAAAVGQRMAVMADGQIRQVGDIEDVFWRPDDRFVAEFLGVDNLLEGIAEQSPQGATQITVGQLTLQSEAADGLSGPVLCTLRPEDVMITKNGPADGTNVYTGTVRQMRDMAFSVRLGVDVCGLSLSARMPRSVYRNVRCSIGDTVTVALPAEAIHVFRDGGDDA